MNANKFTSNGDIYLKINNLNLDNTTNTCLLSFQIEDNGAGIEKNDQAQIFDIYQQASTTYNHTEGFGLGLSIVSKILKQMDSEIKVESTPGEGSIFFFTINTPFETSSTNLDQPSIKNYPPDYFKGKSCLIVDDNEVNLQVTKWHLETYGMDCTTTTSGEESIEIPSTATPGEYHFHLKVVDKNGKTSEVDADIIIEANSANAPVISGLEIGMNDNHKATVGGDLHLDAAITAVGLIDKIEIDLHPESGSGDDIEAVFTNYAGQSDIDFHNHIEIPATATPGEYHFHIKVTDQQGQTTSVDADVEIE